MRFPSNEGVKLGYPLKRGYFAIIGSYSMKMVADRYRLAAYYDKQVGDVLFSFVNIDDLERP